MGPCPALLLLLGLGAAGASTAGPQGSTAGRDGATAPGGTGPSSPGLLSYGAVVAAAVELLNARAVSPYILRLREAQPPPGWVSAELSLARRNSSSAAGSGPSRGGAAPFLGV